MNTARFFAAALLAAAAVSAEAETLTPDEALSRVIGAGGSASTLKSLTGRMEQPELLRTVATPAGVPAAYVFSHADGYLVVAADDVALPLLGYSDAPLPASGEMPPQMGWWLGEYGRQIDYARAQSSGMPALVNPESRADRAPIAPMLTTKWNQGAPFNALCPEISGQNAVTGCVATAMAQVMKYHNYPERGLSSISYDDNGRTLSMNFAQTVFDWANMLDFYSGSYTDAQAEAVATLMKACGYAVKMSYSLTASGSNSRDAANALRTYFGYDAGLELKERDYYSLDQWETMFYENLRDCGPVLCGGADYALSAGHEFVCDGYSSDGFFHFNWGWGGASDGYFRLSALNPSVLGIGGGVGDGFSFAQDAIFGIRRPAGLPTRYENCIALDGALSGSVSGSILTLKANKRWKYDRQAFVNITNHTFSAQLGVKLVSSDGQIRYVEGPYSRDIKPDYGLTEYQVALPLLTSGTYKAYPVFRSTGNGASSSWLDVLQKVGTPGYVVLTLNGGTFSVAEESYGLPKVSKARAETAILAGCVYEISADFANQAPFDVYMPVASGFATLQNNQLSLITRGNIELLELSAGETKRITLKGNATKTAGDFYFVIYTPETMSVLYYMPVKVSANPGKAAIQCTSFSVEGGEQGVNVASIKFDASVTVTSGYLSKPLIIGIFDNKSNTSIAITEFPATYLQAGQSADLTTTYAFAEGQAGMNYTAGLFNPDDTSDMLASCRFKIGTSGVDNVSAEGGIDIVAGADGVTVSAPAGISSIAVYKLDGTPAAVPSITGVTSVTIPYDTMSAGVYAVSVVDKAGASTTQKIAVR